MANRMGSLRRAASTGALALALGLSGPALAQADSSQAADTDTDGEDSGEILVTAQFREQNLQDKPIAITALNAEMIEARGQTNLSEIGASAPNVTLREAPATLRRPRRSKRAGHLRSPSEGAEIASTSSPVFFSFSLRAMSA